MELNRLKGSKSHKVCNFYQVTHRTHTLPEYTVHYNTQSTGTTLPGRHTLYQVTHYHKQSTTAQTLPNTLPEHTHSTRTHSLPEHTLYQRTHTLQILQSNRPSNISFTKCFFFLNGVILTSNLYTTTFCEGKY